MFPIEVVQRFWSYVDKQECWLWLRGCDRYGYGSFNHDKRRYQAHRFAWLVTHGTIQDGLCVLHHCDNPKCVKPNHLFLGTRTDNAIDMDRKNRRKRVARKTHCMRGHELTVANTYVIHSKSQGILRTCRTCRLAATARQAQKSRVVAEGWLGCEC